MRGGGIVSCLFVMGLCMGSACGGKVVFDTSTSGAGGAKTTSASTGGCDPAAHSIALTDFNVTCNVASDCMPVYVGSLCEGCTDCPTAAINVTDLGKYNAEKQAKFPTAAMLSSVTGGCFCGSTFKTSCQAGHCALQ